VVLSTNASGNCDIAYVTVAAPHAAATSITSRSALDQTAPSVQPDMVRLAYAQSDPAIPGPSDIFTAYSDHGTDEFPLAVDPAQRERSPAFSPDATEIVYVTEAGLVIAAAGASPHPLAIEGVTGAADPTGRSGRRSTARRRRPRSPRLRSKDSADEGETALRVERARLELSVRARPAKIHQLRVTPPVSATEGAAPQLPRPRDRPRRQRRPIAGEAPVPGHRAD
jgi:hypothetical protein